MNDVPPPPPTATRAELAAMSVAMLLCSGAIIAIGASNDPLQLAQAGSSPIRQLVWLTTYALAALTFLGRGLIGTARDHVPRAGIMLVGISILSVLWSADPPGTLRESVLLIGTMAVACVVGGRLSLQELLRVNGWAIVLGIVASLAVAVAAPSLATMHDVRGDMWRGAYSHKNQLGIIMAWGVAVTTLLARQQRGLARIGWACSCIGALALLVLSQSRTGIVVLVAASLVTWVITHVGRLPQRAAIAGTLLVGAAVLALGVCIVTWADDVAAALGRDVTLTGRTTIWTAVLHSIEDRPWLGYGFNAFWGDETSPARRVWLEHGVGFGVTEFRAMSAHNGWLNLWLDMGIGAVACALVLVGGGIRATARLARCEPAAASTMPLLFVTYFVLTSLVEGVMLDANSFFWVNLIAVLTATSRRLETHAAR